MKKLRLSRLLSLLFFTSSLGIPCQGVKAASFKPLKSLLTFSLLLYGKLTESVDNKNVYQFEGFGPSFDEAMSAIKGFSDNPMTAFDKIKEVCERNDHALVWENVNRELGGVLGDFPFQRYDSACNGLLSRTPSPTEVTSAPTTHAPTEVTRSPTTVPLTLSPTKLPSTGGSASSDEDKKFRDTAGFIVLVTLSSLAGFKLLVGCTICLGKKAYCGEQCKTRSEWISQSFCAPCWQDLWCKILFCGQCYRSHTIKSACGTCEACCDFFTCTLAASCCVHRCCESVRVFFCAEDCYRDERIRQAGITLQVNQSSNQPPRKKKKQKKQQKQESVNSDIDTDKEE